MKRFKITYTDCGEQMTCTFKGYDARHAEERFWDSFEAEGGSQGIVVYSVKPL